MDTIHPLYKPVHEVTILTPANPAAGASFLLGFQPFAEYRVLYVQASFVADANVANRMLRLMVNDALVGRFFSPCYCVFTAGLTGTIYWMIGYPETPAAIHPTTLIPTNLPSNVTLDAILDLQIIVDNIQATDQLLGITIALARWIRPYY